MLFDSLLLNIGIVLILALWVMGLVFVWRLQTRSRYFVKVKLTDRLMAIAWLPIYIGAILWLIWLSFTHKTQPKSAVVFKAVKQ